MPEQKANQWEQNLNPPGMEEKVYDPGLYMVASPIGNLRDISLRALDILKQASVIACEDTRHSSRLLNFYGIRKTLLPCHAHNEERASQEIIKKIEKGELVAYLSDAGTPGVSDPGSRLVRAVRDAGLLTVPIPGASALTAILSIAAFKKNHITFAGFLSPKGGKRRTQLKNLLEKGDEFIVYESPHRVIKFLSDLNELEPSRSVLLGRELTKMHEEVVEGSPLELISMLEKRKTIKGEIVILISGHKSS